MGIGIAIGLGLAASGWTATKIAKFVEAKIASLEAGTAHTKAVTSMVAGYYGHRCGGSCGYSAPRPPPPLPAA